MSKRNGKTAEAYVDPGADLMNPVTVAEMVATYNKAIRMVEQGYQMLEDAQAMLVGTFGKGNNFGTIATGDYRTTAAEVVKRQLHKSVWRVVIDKLDIWKVLSLKRAEELRKLLAEGEIVEKGEVVQKLPPISDEEILSMIESARQNAKEYAEEFALEVYEWLMPGNKGMTHWEAGYATNKRNARDELGKKIILGWMIRPGYSSQHPFNVQYDRHEKLAALDRLFALMDGQPAPEINTYQSPLCVAIEQSGWDGKFETEYFKGRACHNGNLHLEFKRLDLVQKLNQIAGNPTSLRQKRHKIKKGDRTEVHVPEAPESKAEKYEEAFYWSPEPVVKRMLELVPLPPPLLLRGKRFLEPSAGEGHIADCLVAAGVDKLQLTCIEKNYHRIGALLHKGYYVEDKDFLQFKRDGWDYIFMNPPFNQEQDILHVMHAYKLLAPGGWLCAIMSEHDFTSVSRGATYFRDWLENVGGKNEKLPEHSFVPAGTTWSTRVVWVQKPLAA